MTFSQKMPLSSSLPLKQSFHGKLERMCEGQTCSSLDGSMVIRLSCPVNGQHDGRRSGDQRCLLGKVQDPGLRLTHKALFPYSYYQEQGATLGMLIEFQGKGGDRLNTLHRKCLVDYNYTQVSGRCHYCLHLFVLVSIRMWRNMYHLIAKDVYWNIAKNHYKIKII